jgi:arylsulfatase A-like enzyme
VVLWGFYDEYFYKDKIDIHNAAQMEYVRSLYDQKLYDVDDTVIRKIRDAMTKTSLKNNTIVIITSEHGEEFGEHGVFGHTTLYDLNLKVPFMMSIPHMDPFSISNNVQLVDIMPTILSVLGIKNHFTFDGTSLVPLLSGQQIPDRLLIAEGGYWQDTLPQKAIRDGNWKVLIALKGTEIIPYELYNIKVDPQEKNNVILSNYATAKRIIEKYKRALN